jgi:membrane-associated phospholipid phosphatase
MLSLDQYLAGLHLKMHHPGFRPWINGYVMFGQRAPATLTFLPLFFWMAWRERSKRPLVMLGTALVLLNLTVGVVKYATGRVGPMHVGDARVHDIFAGGNIYPSGHVSNAVVLYGLAAWIVVPRLRRIAITLAVLLSVTVGLSTVYLRTHWFSDVIGGWLAGSLVLLSLPTVLPFAERQVDRALDWLRGRFAWLRTRPTIRQAASGRHAAVRRQAQSQRRAAAPPAHEHLDEPTRVG